MEEKDIQVNIKTTFIGKNIAHITTKTKILCHLQAIIDLLDDLEEKEITQEENKDAY